MAEWGRVVQEACEVSRKDRAGRLVNELIEETYLSPRDTNERLDKIWNRLLGWHRLLEGDTHEAARYIGLRTEF
jgi:hypothetical protein